MVGVAEETIQAHSILALVNEYGKAVALSNLNFKLVLSLSDNHLTQKVFVVSYHNIYFLVV
jgi:hypothetical protein